MAVSFLLSAGSDEPPSTDYLQKHESVGRHNQERQLQLIITDGCPGLAAAIQTVHPRVLHQRCWVHKIRNLTEHARKGDRGELKQAAQAIYQAETAHKQEWRFAI